MKELRFKRLLPIIYILVSACGQPGPLYLPTDKPPIYVPPAEQTKIETEAKPETAQKEIKSPRQPDNNQPKEQ